IVSRRIRPEEGVVDQGGDACRCAAGRVDADTRRPRGEHALQPIRTARFDDGVASAADGWRLVPNRPEWVRGAQCRAPSPGTGIHLGRELVDDDVDEAFQLGTFHRVRCSRSRIFASRRIYRGSCIDAPSQAATILVASSALTRVAPSVKMFAPLCSRAY